MWNTKLCFVNAEPIPYAMCLGWLVGDVRSNLLQHTNCALDHLHEKAKKICNQAAIWYWRQDEDWGKMIRTIKHGHLKGWERASVHNMDVTYWGSKFRKYFGACQWSCKANHPKSDLNTTHSLRLSPTIHRNSSPSWNGWETRKQSRFFPLMTFILPLTSSLQGFISNADLPMCPSFQIHNGTFLSANTMTRSWTAF